MNISLLRQSIRSAARIQCSRSGGPGGQNVNKVNTKVTLHLRLGEVAGLSPAETGRARELLANRISSEDDLVITADEERSQKSNRERALCRAEALIAGAARLPKRRRPTRPSKAAGERRLRGKKLNGQKKAERRQDAAHCGD
jgi:ribosome-associated protein